MIHQTFQTLCERNELALIPYVTAGFPTLDASIETLARIAEHGPDLLEIGIPFSDPVADGPTIQQASQVALDNGVCLPQVLDALRSVPFRQPLVAMSYLNPLLAQPAGTLFTRMKDAGLSGLIIPDLPPEESDDWLAAARDAGIHLVFLVAPTSSAERIARIAERCDAFVYYVSVTGTTGARRALPSDLSASLQRVRRATDKPVAVGFGIAEPEQIRSLHGHADGVVVGSRIVEAVRRGEDVAELITQLKQATRSEFHAGRHESRS